MTGMDCFGQDSKTIELDKLHDLRLPLYFPPGFCTQVTLHVVIESFT